MLLMPLLLFAFDTFQPDTRLSFSLIFPPPRFFLSFFMIIYARRRPLFHY